MVSKTMKLYVTLLPVFLLTAASAVAETSVMSEETSPECAFQLDLSDKSEIANWRVLLDGVMGGRSTGVRYAEDGAMTFKGEINTNGGGFSSLRRPMRPGMINGANSLDMRVKSDGRAYKLTFRTNAARWGRSISYQLDIPQTPKGKWTNVTLPLDGFRTSIFGRTVRAKPFDPKDVREMGIILADGIDGPFELNLRSLSCSPTTMT